MSARHDEGTKAAVMAVLLTGQSVASVAREYKLPRRTVRDWQEELGPMTEQAPAERHQKGTIGEALYGYLHANIAALTSQQELFANKAWLKEQPANELAVLHGVSADKAIRLLEALSHAEGAEDA